MSKVVKPKDKMGDPNDPAAAIEQMIRLSRERVKAFDKLAAALQREINKKKGLPLTDQNYEK